MCDLATLKRELIEDVKHDKKLNCLRKTYSKQLIKKEEEELKKLDKNDEDLDDNSKKELIDY